MTDGTQMECADALRRMHEFLDRELDVANMDAVREHLHACEPCLENFDAEEAFKELVRRRCGASDVNAPETLRRRILTQITPRG